MDSPPDIRWVIIERGQPIPEDAVESGSTMLDGALWVGRENGEAGKINARDGKMHNFRTHGNFMDTVLGHKKNAEILCCSGISSWHSIERGQAIPPNAVKASDTATEGSGGTYVGRFSGEAGKINLEGGNMLNFCGHQSGRRDTAEVLVIGRVRGASEDSEWMVEVVSPSKLPVDGWQADHEVESCPLCAKKFSQINRKHHCRQCGRVVCDPCSPTKMRLPKLPQDGKVRVCNPCVDTLGARQATGFEEDLEAFEQSIGELRKADRAILEECDVFKRVLLELDADASGDSSLLEEHFIDPETDLASFGTLKERAQREWNALLDGRVQIKIHRQELLEGFQACLQRMEEARLNEEELKGKKAELMGELRMVDKVDAEKDELGRRDADLNKEIADARKLVRELEMQRKAHQDQQREGSTSGSSAGARSRMLAPRSSPDTEAFTISEGQGDSWNQRSRVEGCRDTVRQRCVVM